MRKNIIFQIYNCDEESLRFNISHLSKYFSIFDGKKVCYLKYDSTTKTPSETIQTLSEYGIVFDKYIEIENSIEFKDAYKLNELFEEIVDEPGMTFYGHVKGVRSLHNGDTASKSKPIQNWIKCLYFGCFGNVPLIENDMYKGNHDISVPILIDGYIGNVTAPWHGTGMFFWVKNIALKNSNWKRPITSVWDAESWMGNTFPLYRCSITLFRAKWFNPYIIDTWDIISKKMPFVGRIISE